MHVTDAPGRDRWARAWPDLLAFLAGLAVARWGAWHTGDLVWSLWLSSLVVGYTSILWGSFSPAVLALREGQVGEGVVALIGGLFSVAFFTVHFGMFHLVHAVFLNLFFPVFAEGDFPDPDAFLHLLRSYALFLPVAFLAERRNFTLPAVPPEPPATSVKAADIATRKMRRQFGSEALHRPYLNVVRMHLLIFAFAGLHFARIEGFGVYAAVYACYFFPWRLLRALPATAPASARERA